MVDCCCFRSIGIWFEWFYFWMRVRSLSANMNITKWSGWEVFFGDYISMPMLSLIKISPSSKSDNLIIYWKYQKPKKLQINCKLITTIIQSLHVVKHMLMPQKWNLYKILLSRHCIRM
jgi:hypothetical protein